MEVYCEDLLYDPLALDDIEVKKEPQDITLETETPLFQSDRPQISEDFEQVNLIDNNVI